LFFQYDEEEAARRKKNRKKKRLENYEALSEVKEEGTYLRIKK
jgi:hypothetical protein